MTATPERKQAFANLVRTWSFEQAADALRTIDRIQSEQADWMREILHTQYPALADNPTPNIVPQTVYLESAANRQQIDNLQRQVESLRLELQQRPHYTPPFNEHPTNDYTPVQMFVMVSGVGAFATWAVVKFLGPAIVAAVGALLNGAMYAGGALILGGALYFILKRAEVEPEQVPMDGTIIINQTVIVNNGKHERN